MRQPWNWKPEKERVATLLDVAEMDPHSQRPKKSSQKRSSVKMYDYKSGKINWHRNSQDRALIISALSKDGLRSVYNQYSWPVKKSYRMTKDGYFPVKQLEAIITKWKAVRTEGDTIKNLPC